MRAARQGAHATACPPTRGAPQLVSVAALFAFPNGCLWVLAGYNMEPCSASHFYSGLEL